MSHIYKNLVFTNHAYDRIRSRNINEQAIFETVSNPNKKFKKNKNSLKYIKAINDRVYHVVATYKPSEKKHVVISAWVRGEEDKLPIVWRIITLPFKLIWWLIKKFF